MNNNTVTATVTMIINTLRHNNQNMVTKYKKGKYKSDRATSTWYILGNTNAGGIVTFRPYISKSIY